MHLMLSCWNYHCQGKLTLKSFIIFYAGKNKNMTTFSKKGTIMLYIARYFCLFYSGSACSHGWLCNFFVQNTWTIATLIIVWSKIYSTKHLHYHYLLGEILCSKTFNLVIQYSTCTCTTSFNVFLVGVQRNVRYLYFNHDLSPTT